MTQYFLYGSLLNNKISINNTNKNPSQFTLNTNASVNLVGSRNIIASVGNNIQKLSFNQISSNLSDICPTCESMTVEYGSISGSLLGDGFVTNPSIGIISNNNDYNILLTIIGGVDDDVLINNKIYEPGKYPFWDDGSNGAHSFSYSTILEPDTSIVLGANSYGIAGNLGVEWTAQCTTEEIPPDPSGTTITGDGSNAVFNINYLGSIVDPDASPIQWKYGISSVDVISGGSGYIDSQPATITFDPEYSANTEALCYIKTQHIEPTVIATTNNLAGGSGAEFGPVTLYNKGDGYWGFDSVTILNPGSGYFNGWPIDLTVTDGLAHLNQSGTIYVASVNGTGGILTINKSHPGSFYKETGIIDRIIVEKGGEYV